MSGIMPDNKEWNLSGIVSDNQEWYLSGIVSDNMVHFQRMTAAGPARDLRLFFSSAGPA